MIVAIAAAIIFVQVLWRPTRSSAGPSVPVSVLALVGLGFLGLFQAMRWPAALAKWISPGHVSLHSASAAIAENAADPGWVSFSLAPGASLGAGLGFLALAGLLFASFEIGRHRRPRRLVMAALGVALVTQVLLGLKGLTQPLPEIWGLQVQGPTGRLRGTFVNPNHAALFFEIGLSAAFAWVWWASRRGKGRIDLDRRLVSVLPACLAWGIVLLALILTGSRAGLLAAGFGLALQVFLVGRRMSRRWVVATAGLAIAAAIVVLALVGGNRALGRLLSTTPFEDNLQARAQMTLPALRLWSRFPIIGVGLRSFEDGFPLVQPQGELRATWNRAHNDPLELLVTGGVIGLLLFGAGAWLVGKRLLRVFSGSRRTENRAAALAALGALAVVSIHELFDFGLTVPANALTLTMLVGLAAGAGRTVRKRTRSETSA